jgi:hypothetical protein
MPASSLYVAQRSDAPRLVKVGRASDVAKRMAALQSGHVFRVSAAAVFPKLGALEAAVHKRLRRCRVEGFGAREWFECDVETAVEAILQEKRRASPDSNGDDGTSCDTGRPYAPYWEGAFGLDGEGKVAWINPERLYDALNCAAREGLAQSPPRRRSQSPVVPRRPAPIFRPSSPSREQLPLPVCAGTRPLRPSKFFRSTSPSHEHPRPLPACADTRPRRPSKFFRSAD